VAAVPHELQIAAFDRKALPPWHPDFGFIEIAKSPACRYGLDRLLLITQSATLRAPGRGSAGIWPPYWHHTDYVYLHFVGLTLQLFDAPT
jgi:hypothetical protein